MVLRADPLSVRDPPCSQHVDEVGQESSNAREVHVDQRERGAG
jgi:hypothetical protein